MGKGEAAGNRRHCVEIPRGLKIDIQRRSTVVAIHR